MTVLELQTLLAACGFNPGPLDGIRGPKTNAAEAAYRGAGRPGVLPWMLEITKVLGLHETRDNPVLTEWLRSDGHLLGDPSKLPWCGDAVETPIRRALPDEKLPSNPYWARNWTGFGVECGRAFGAVASFARGSGGHVAFLVGTNREGTLLRIRGGNQANAINDTWISASRLLALRWPATYPKSEQRDVPVLDSTGAVISKNEA